MPLWVYEKRIATRAVCLLSERHPRVTWPPEGSISRGGVPSRPGGGR